MKKNDSAFFLRLPESRGVKGLWQLLSGYRLLYIVALVSVAFASLSRTLSLLVIRYLVDDVLVSKTVLKELPLMAVLFAGLAVLEGAGLFLKGKFSAMAAEGAVQRLRDFLLDHIQRLSFTYHDHTDSGNLIERVTTDVDILRKFYSEKSIAVGRIVSLFIFNLAGLLFLNVKLGLVSLLFIPFILFQSWWFFKKISKRYEDYQVQEAKLSSVLKENISSIRIVKAFARQSFERDKFEKINYGKFKKGRRVILLHSLFWPVSDILCTTQLLFVYYLGARMAIAGDISIGTYISIAGMVVWIIWPIRNLGEVIIDASQAFVSYDRISKIVSQKQEDSGDTDTGNELFIRRGEIDFSGVNFSYSSGEEALMDISFHAEAGSRIALVGTAGSGKTTLINLLPRFYDTTSGTITIDGVDIRSIPRSGLRRQIGIVEQEPFLFSRSIRDNIVFGAGADVSQEAVVEAARAAAVHDVIMGFPKGYETMVGEKGVTLSGGQKQRIVIARTLLKNPKILILDDATSSVDTKTERAIRQALSALLKGRTSFVIAHRIQTVMEADRIIVLERGRIVEVGSHTDLVSNDGFYRKVFDLQMGGEGENV
ncbi:MAG: ABC transporter ATP-binding protein [Spirochaetes bacterium]|nr:MAG: ABC transporter ATP-binding protein [Spirochaetota bacterium]